jgi:short subunit dehydrogenase-like uncharacterized protein
MKDKLLLYGANGYTGQLIIEESLRNNIKPILAGRSEKKLTSLAEQYGLEYKVFALEETEKLEQSLQNVKVVLHAAGPFIYTCKPMLQACLNTQTHYLDITGEYQIFEFCASRNDEAKQKGIMVMPGTGFDVVPSDCLAAYLKKNLTTAIDLKLAFAGLKSGFSRGTAKTMVEGLGYGGMVRIDHKLINVQNAYQSMNVDFGDFKTIAATIPWGDLSTAYISTGIPNIEVYMGITPQLLKQMQRSNYLGWLFRQRWVKNILLKQIDKRKPGPSEKQREEGRSYFFGRVADNAGNVKTAILKTPEGYKLTALTSVNIAKKVLENNFKPGYQTPSTAYTEKLILEIPNCSLSDVKG